MKPRDESIGEIIRRQKTAAALKAQERANRRDATDERGLIDALRKRADVAEGMGLPDTACDLDAAIRRIEELEAEWAALIEAVTEYLDVLDNAPDESSTSELRLLIARTKGDE